MNFLIGKFKLLIGKTDFRNKMAYGLFDTDCMVYATGSIEEYRIIPLIHAMGIRFGIISNSTGIGFDFEMVRTLKTKLRQTER